MSPDLLFGVAALVFGLAFGSFLNVCIHRLPRGESVVMPASACPKCHHAIRAFDNVPVLSWLLLRGKCRDCGAPISPRYAAVESLTALLFLACYLVFGPTLFALKYMVFSFLILGLIFTDAEHHLLPDALTLPGLVLGFVFSLFIPMENTASFLLNTWLSVPFPSWHWASFFDAVVGAALGASFIYGAGAIYFHARGVEGMGFGDVKLMAMVGAFLGIKLTIMTIFAGSLVGTFAGLATMLAVWMKRTRRRLQRNREAPEVARRRAWQSARLVYRRYEMPFGVFLGCMAMLSVFFGNQLFAWYMDFYR